MAVFIRVHVKVERSGLAPRSWEEMVSSPEQLAGWAAQLAAEHAAVSVVIRRRGPTGRVLSRWPEPGPERDMPGGGADALAFVAPFLNPLLDGTAAGVWDPQRGRWT